MAIVPFIGTIGPYISDFMCNFDPVGCFPKEHREADLTNTPKEAAIVTGGGTGIGRAISLALAKRGYAIAVVYRQSEGEAKDTVDEITKNGGRACALRADVRDEKSIYVMVNETASKFGKIKYLVNGSAITQQLDFSNLDDVEDEFWDELYGTNVKGAFLCTRAVTPYLKEVAGAAIVNIGSIAGETGYGSSIPYAASKAALHGLTKSLARALAPDIRVNCVAPGAVHTRWWEGNEEKMMTLSGQLPLQRVSTPEDIADIVIMLLEALSMTGQVIKADNGQTL